jgi:hypothetical protein
VAGDSIFASRAGGGVNSADCVTIVSGDKVNCCRHFGQLARVVPGGMTPGAIFLLKPQCGQVTTACASIVPSLGLILIGIFPGTCDAETGITEARRQDSGEPRIIRHLGSFSETRVLNSGVLH